MDFARLIAREPIGYIMKDFAGNLTSFLGKLDGEAPLIADPFQLGQLAQCLFDPFTTSKIELKAD